MYEKSCDKFHICATQDENCNVDCLNYRWNKLDSAETSSVRRVKYVGRTLKNQIYEKYFFASDAGKQIMWDWIIENNIVPSSVKIVKG